MDRSMTSNLQQKTDRRRFTRLMAGLGLGVMTLGLSACAGVQSQPRDPNRKPFWERNEQRDD
ncbi:hypothetical protein HBA54_08760 [Pelagibius litoralis]|uniref:Uncharacterized protein n=1 Tax=Pelagibius litoralis TaxID=374515 RepID=A0A967C6W9_9PROT|nr:hypothetical protein [Pelagibius litoralis]NIA68681.1 hypothetical protein [Pelagibius litoralis]